MDKKKLINEILDTLSENNGDSEAAAQFLLDCLNEANDSYNTRFQKKKQADKIAEDIAEFVRIYYPTSDFKFSGETLINTIECHDAAMDFMADLGLTPDEAVDKSIDEKIEDFLARMKW